MLEHPFIDTDAQETPLHRTKKNRQLLKLPYKRVVELRLVEPELSTEHLSAYYIGFIACGLSCILFVLLAVIRFFCYHRSTHLIYNFTMTKVSAAKVRRK